MDPECRLGGLRVYLHENAKTSSRDSYSPVPRPAPAGRVACFMVSSHSHNERTKGRTDGRTGSCQLAIDPINIELKSAAAARECDADVNLYWLINTLSIT